MKPILLENHELDNLDIVEIERIFGFKDNYTKIKSLCKTIRLKLIGKAFSIQAFTELLRPLTLFFDQIFTKLSYK